MVGSSIEHYRIIERIGVGGMGEVYRAEDTKLKRDVAIKVLPKDLSRDEDLMERFEREARILASLNHPNVGAIYGLVDTEGSRALVLELVDGPTLREHLDAAASAGGRGLPLREALTLALQMAAGLEAAHDKGIVHRDLKPDNVKLAGESQIKILDFGLGKPLAETGSSGESSGGSALITLRRHTSHGMILGTASYMPPEQARGNSVDRRADIWSFAVVLFEMLTGANLFSGESVTDVLAAVVSQDIDLGGLPRDTPPSIRRLLRRCLERDPNRRLRDIREARLAIESVLNEPGVSDRWRDGFSSDTITRHRAVLWTGALVIASGLAFVAGSRWTGADRPAQRPPVRASLELPDDVYLGLGMRPSLSLSPDGSRLVIVTEQDGALGLSQRTLSEESFVAIPGTNDGSGPFFSDDGQFIGFFAEGKLKRVPSAGGAPTVLADAAAGQGGSFTPDGSVVFNGVHGEGLFIVSGSGGVAEPLTTVDREAGEAGHHWPHLLPDGKHALATVEVTGKEYSEARIVLVSIEDRNAPPKVLFDGGTDARYVSSGHVVYWSVGDLWARAFDSRKLEVTGAPFLVTRNVMAGAANGFAQYALSNDGGGTLAFLSGRDPGQERNVVLIDRAGIESPLTAERRSFESPRIAPNGQRLVVSVTAANDSLWVYDFERRTLTRMTLEDENRRAVWSPTSEKLAFFSDPGGRRYAIHVADLEAGGSPASLRESDRPELPESWSASGVLAFTRRDAETGSDVWVVPVPMGDGAEARPILSSRFDEGEARFSYDGRWLAYQSDESGRPEVYVVAFPGPGAKRQISVSGGTQPRWRGDGGELYFRDGDVVMAVTVDSRRPSSFAISIPRELFRGLPADENLDTTSWDALPDGQGFVFIREYGQPARSLQLVMNWFAELSPPGGR